LESFVLFDEEAATGIPATTEGSSQDEGKIVEQIGDINHTGWCVGLKSKALPMCEQTDRDLDPVGQRQCEQANEKSKEDGLEETISPKQPGHDPERSFSLRLS